MRRRYFICGDKLMAFNAKVGTSTFARAIVKKYYGDLDAKLLSAAYPEGQSADTLQVQSMVPYRVNPDRPVVLLVRDPVERFRSAMAQVNLDDVDATITELLTEEGAYGYIRGVKLVENAHFVKQSTIKGNPIYYFKFPEQVDEAARFLGLDLPLVIINENTRGDKPDVTEAQAEAIRQFYTEDYNLWSSL
jgi:hypothetical protein